MGNCFNKNEDNLVSPENHLTDIHTIFKIVKQLGEGASCDVFECIHISSDKKVALKRMTKNKINLDLFKKEIDILSQVKHSNIIELVDTYSDKEYFYIATALCTGGELFDRIVKAEKFTEKLASKLIRQMLNAIKHIHSLNIVHRDLKPENFVFETDDEDSEIRLIDFGCAKKISLDEEYSDIVGTPYYLAPEYLKSKKRDGSILKASDVWAIGVIAYILVTGQPPFNGKNNNRIFHNIVKQQVKFPSHVKNNLTKELKDFIKTLLNKDPSKRPSAEDALNHPWVSGKVKLSDKEIGSLTFLVSFQHESRLKKALAETVIHYAPQKDKDKLKNMFSQVDKDGDGQVTEAELKQVFQKMGYYVTEAEKKAKEVMDKCDLDGDGYVTFEEFSHVHASHQLSSDLMLIHTCFTVMDDNGDGFISLQELKNSLNLDDKEAQLIFDEADLNGDGVISFDEFKLAMSSGISKNNVKKNNLIAGIGLDKKDIATIDEHDNVK